MSEPFEFKSIESTALFVEGEGHYGVEGLLITARGLQNELIYIPITIEVARELAERLLKIVDEIKKTENVAPEGGTDMSRFTDSNHPNFWRSNNPYSPAYRAPRNLRELIKTIYYVFVGWL